MNLHLSSILKSLFLYKIIFLQFLIIIFVSNSHSTLTNTTFLEVNNNSSNLDNTNLQFLKLQEFIVENSKFIVENEFIIIFDNKGFLHTYNSIEENLSGLETRTEFFQTQTFNSQNKFTNLRVDEDNDNTNNSNNLVDTKQIAQKFLENFTHTIDIIEKLIEEKITYKNSSQQINSELFESRNVYKNSKKSLETPKNNLNFNSNSKEEFSILKEHKHLFSGITIQANIEIIEFLMNEFPDFKIIPNYKVELFISEQTRELLELNEIYNLQINNTNLTGRGITVAVLDTGIDYTHPDFGSCSTPQDCQRILDFYDFSSSNPLDIMDRQGHGTHVASTIGSNNSNPQFKGVAPEVNFYIYKVFQDITGFGSIDWIIESLERALDPTGNMNYSNRADIISMSLGIPMINDPNFLVDLELDEIAQISIPIVAAGNNGSQGFYSVASPGSSRGVITVGATTINDEIAPFSSRGPTEIGTLKPDILAPGVNICAAKSSYASISSFLNCQGSTQHYFNSGTSMATPIVSGTVALMLQQNTSLTTRQVKSILRETALDIGISPTIQGWGRIQPLRAIEKAGESCIVEFNTTQLESTINISEFEIPALINCNNFTHYNIFLDVLNNTGSIISTYKLQNGTQQGDLELVINRSSIISDFALLRLESYYESFNEEELVLKSNNDMLFTSTRINQTLQPFEEISHCVNIYREGVFILNTNISTSEFDKPCINIKSSNVKIQCQENTILFNSNSSNTSSLAILIENASNVSVINCNFDSFSKGILGVNSSVVTISNNSFSNVLEIHLELNEVTNSIISHNNFLNLNLNLSLALYLNNSNSNNTFYQNSFMSNTSINSSNWDLNEFNFFNTTILVNSTLNISVGNYWIEQILSCEVIENISLDEFNNISLCQEPNNYTINLENNVVDFAPLFSQELFDMFYLSPITRTQLIFENQRNYSTPLIMSGHSLTDPIHSMLNLLISNVSNLSQEEIRIDKSTIPGSPMDWRWNNPSHLPDARLNISEYKVLVMTERVSLSNTLPYHNSLEQALIWYNHSVENGNNGSGAEMILYATWVDITSGPDYENEFSDPQGNIPFRERLDLEFEMWESIFNYVNENKIENASNITMIPATLILAKVYDEIENGTAPSSFTNISDFFEDTIHLNELGSYLVTLAHYSVLYGKSPLGLPNDIGQTSQIPTLEEAQWMQELVFNVLVNYSNSGISQSVITLPQIESFESNITSISESATLELNWNSSYTQFCSLNVLYEEERETINSSLQTQGQILVDISLTSININSINSFEFELVCNNEFQDSDLRTLTILVEKESSSSSPSAPSGRSSSSSSPPLNSIIEQVNTSSSTPEENHSLENRNRNSSINEERVVTFNSENFVSLNVIQERFSVNSQSSDLEISMSSIDESTNSRISILNSQNRRAGVVILVDEFDISQINFEQIEIIENVFNGRNYMLVNNIFLDEAHSKSKSLIIEQSSSNIKEVCIKDAPISSITQISQDCTGEFEFILSCDSQIIQDKYSCTLVNEFFQIDGLRHSGVIEFVEKEESIIIEENIEVISSNPISSQQLMISGLIGIVVVIIIITILILISKEHHLRAPLTKHESNVEDIEQIKKYIQKHKTLFSQEILKEELLKVGYNKKDITKVLREEEKED
ncbi:MAG: S8 family serine peptidase [Nanoarchaeota archaeon]|nr:S8 family serine peptidase [Nanoarchaeota archaeon]